MPAEPKPSDGLYPMRAVTRMTGLTSHTIRVWERRYGAVVPHRTAGNTRRYSSEDVHKLTLLHKATELGYPIREVAQYDAQALEELIQQERRVDLPSETLAAVPDDPLAGLRAEYLDHIEAFDHYRALEILTRASALLTTADLVFEVLLPILRQTGARWEAGSFTVAHEHAVSAQARGLLDTLMRRAAPRTGAPRVVIATPATHRHEFGALAAAHLAVSRGFEPVYLGPDVPDIDLLDAVSRSGAGLVLLSVERAMDPSESRGFDDLLQRLGERCDVWVGSPPDHNARDRVEGVRYFHQFEDLDRALADEE
jgi:MerR family transcriptional regulator, light-induced transcriptional regulator